MRLKNVAVVAVHGVADQQPGVSARQVAGLLLSLSRRRPSHAASADPPVERHTLYTTFREYAFQLPLHRLAVHGDARRTEAKAPPKTLGGRWRRLWAPFEERSVHLRHDAASKRDGPLAALDYRVAHEQLSDYEPGDEERFYQTLRLEGHVLDAGPVEEKERVVGRVHVFEMYWADLSRLGTGALQVFGELYQLLLNLPHLGRQTLDFAATRHARNRSWQRVAALHRYAVRWLTLPLPLLNLSMLAIGFAFLPLALLDRVQGAIALAALGIGIASAVAYLMPPLRRGHAFELSLWLGVPAVAVALGIAGAVWANRALTHHLNAIPLAHGRKPLPSAWHLLLLAEWIVASGVALRALVSAYQKRRPGAQPVGWLAHGGSLALLVGFLWNPDLSITSVQVALARTFVVQWYALSVCWIVVIALVLAGGIARRPLWRWCHKRGRSNLPLKRARARRALRVAPATLAVSTMLLLLVTLTAWSVAYEVARRAIPNCSATTTVIGPVPVWRRLSHVADEESVARQTFALAQERASSDLMNPATRADAAAQLDSLHRNLPPDCLSWVKDLSLPHGGRAGVQSYLHELLGMSGTAGFVPMGACAAIALLVAVWALAPVVRTEIAPPSLPNDDGRHDARAARERAWHESRRALWLGRWLSRGFDALPFAGRLIFWSVFAVLPAFGLLGFLRWWLRADAAAAFSAWAACSWTLDAAALAAWLRSAMHLGGVGVDALYDATRFTLQTAGTAIAASAVGVLALRGRLDVLALGFRPVIDVALDVESYLRLHPSTRTPRARIVERYASLLRYLCRWRSDDAAPQRYDAIVIVAHSQGSVITADLLAFLERERLAARARSGSANSLWDFGTRNASAPEATEIPVYLFTMGSPLRQLYATAFPHQYDWVEGRADRRQQLDPTEPEDACLPPLGRSTAAGAPHVTASDECIERDARPDPWAIGLTRWVNAYRSGDYVGRSLWRKIECGTESTLLHRRSCFETKDTVLPASPDDSPYFIRVSEDERYSRRECCIGGGAHTHYWDATAHDVAIELDLLVRDALASRRPDESLYVTQLAEPGDHREEPIDVPRVVRHA